MVDTAVPCEDLDKAFPTKVWFHASSKEFPVFSSPRMTAVGTEGVEALTGSLIVLAEKVVDASNVLHQLVTLALPFSMALKANRLGGSVDGSSSTVGASPGSCSAARAVEAPASLSCLVGFCVQGDVAGPVDLVGRNAGGRVGVGKTETGEVNNRIAVGQVIVVSVGIEQQVRGIQDPDSAAPPGH